MKKTVAACSSILLLSPFMPSIVKSAYASTTISNNININNDGGNSNVNIHSASTTKISQSSTTTSTGNTHVRIENNGVVKEYNSDQPGELNMQSDDGNTSVRINNGQTDISHNKDLIATNEAEEKGVQKNHDDIKGYVEKKNKETKKQIIQIQKHLEEQRFDLFKFLKSQFSILGLKFFK